LLAEIQDLTQQAASDAFFRQQTLASLNDDLAAKAAQVQSLQQRLAARQ